MLAWAQTPTRRPSAVAHGPPWRGEEGVSSERVFVPARHCSWGPSWPLETNARSSSGAAPQPGRGVAPPPAERGSGSHSWFSSAALFFFWHVDMHTYACMLACMSVVMLSVRVPEDLRRRLRVRVAEVGGTLEAFVEAALEGALGKPDLPGGAKGSGFPSEVPGDDPVVVHPSDSRAESQAGLNGPSGSPTSSPGRVLVEHRADPKDRAAQEHGRRQRQVRSQLCEHRVPAGAFCKVCDGGE